MPTLGVQSVAPGLKAAGASHSGPGPEELTSALAYLDDPKDIAAIEGAYEVARAAHDGQFRKSGEPYITHPLAVAKSWPSGSWTPRR